MLTLGIAKIQRPFRRHGSQHVHHPASSVPYSGVLVLQTVYWLTVFHSAGFYAENLLLYTKQAQAEGTLPIPIDSHHKFCPVSPDRAPLMCARPLTRSPHTYMSL